MAGRLMAGCPDTDHVARKSTWIVHMRTTDYYWPFHQASQNTSGDVRTIRKRLDSYASTGIFNLASVDLIRHVKTAWW
jgi:hypothetical protein